jgi:DNA-binding protein H-NS
LDARIEAARQAERNQAPSTIRELIAQFGIIASELAMKRGPKKSGNLPATYRDPVSGQTWTGRGKAPAWLAGKDRAASRSWATLLTAVGREVDAPWLATTTEYPDARKRSMEEISTSMEAPDVVRIPAHKLKVGHVHVFRNANGSWSLERVREIYKVTEGPDATVTVGLGPVGHAARTFFKGQMVDITRATSKL